MSDTESQRAERAKGRRTWAIRRTELGDPEISLLDITTPAQRIAMMWPLAVEAYQVAGRSIPDFEWSEAPSRVVRPGDSES